jgi:predicted dehydrogenase
VTLPVGIIGVGWRAHVPIPAFRAAEGFDPVRLEDWLPAFDGDPTGVPIFDDGLLSLTVIDAAHRSAEGGGWEHVDATV